MEEMEEEKKSGWTTILLIINLIIWTIILFIWFIYNGVVNAQGMNMTNWNVRDANDNWYSYANGTTQDVSLINAIGFNFNGTTGNNNGVVYVEGDALGQVATNDISISWWTSPTNNGTGAVSKNCAISKTSTLLWHVKCQFNFTITNNSDNIAILMNIANARNFYSLTVSGYTDVQPNNNATTQDIINQTIQITNQIVESVRNSIQNVEDQSDNIIYQISNAIENAASTIVGTDYECIEIDKDDIKENGKFILGSGSIATTTQPFGLTDYIDIHNSSVTIESYLDSSAGTNWCLYDVNKTQISCYPTTTQTFPNIEGYYLRATIQYNQNKPTFKICKSRTQWIIDNQNSNTNRLIQELYNNNASQIAELNASWSNITVNDTELTNLESIEDDLHTITDVDLDVMTINLDPDTGSWVWNTLTSILNANAMVFGMVISILSIGIIKLILNR